MQNKKENNMPKELRFWNGRQYTLSGYDKSDHVSLAAYSIADARRLFVELGHCNPGYTEIKKYYAETWGNDMNGITPERGIWVVNRFVNDGKPVRLEGENSPEQLRNRTFVTEISGVDYASGKDKTVTAVAKVPADQLYNSITDNNRSLLNDYLDDQQSYIKDLAYCESNNKGGEYHSEPDDKLYDAMQNSLIRLLNGWQKGTK